MALKRRLTKEEFDKLPEALRTEYKASGESDGGYILDVEGIDDITNLEGALRKTREELKATRAEADKFKGIDPERHKVLVQQAEELERKRKEQEGDYKAALEQVNKKHEQELQSLRDEILQRDKTIEGVLVDAKVNEAIAKHAGNPKLLFDVIKKRTKVERSSDGEYAVKVLGEDGKAMVDGKGTPISIDDLVGGLKADKDFGVAFAPSKANGSGSPSDRRATPPVDSKSPRTSLDKIRSGLAKQMGATQS